MPVIVPVTINSMFISTTAKLFLITKNYYSPTLSKNKIEKVYYK